MPLLRTRGLDIATLLKERFVVEDQAFLRRIVAINAVAYLEFASRGSGSWAARQVT